MKVKKLLTLFAAAMMLLGAQNANASVKLTALDGSNRSHASESPKALVDEQTNSKWGTWDGKSGNPVYVIMKASAAIAPKSYELISANDTYKNTGRSWKQWKIYGGNFASDAEATQDASGWVEIDSKASHSLSVGTESNPYAVNKLDISTTIPNGTYYSYFKIVVDSLAGNWNDDYCQMDGFRFTNVKFKPQDVTFTYTNGHGYNGNSAEGMDKLFDLDCNTKYCGNTNAHDSCYALVTASEPIFVWGYDLTTANDNNNGRKVSKWSLYGTNDATVAANPYSADWVTLSKITSGNYVEGKNWYTQRFFCDKNTISNAYKYFKVSLDDGGFVQLSEFRLCYDTYRAIAYNLKSGPANASSAFDGLPNPKWEGNASVFTGSSNAITIESSDGNSYAVKKYHFTTNDDGSWTDRAPKSWKIEGSNDNSDWTTIAEVDDKYAIHNANYTTYEFTPDNTTDAFRYVRLTINSMKSAGWSQIGDFQVLAVSDVSDKDYYTGRVNDTKAALSDYATLMGTSDPWYVEYKALVDGLDDILDSSISSGNYDPIATALLNTTNFAALMTPFADGLSYSAIDGSASFNDSPYSQLFDGKDGREGRQGTKWGGNFSGNEGDPQHVQYVIFRVKSAFAPYFYKLVTGGDTHTYTGRNWKSWSVYGANFDHLADATPNSASWIALDEREDISEAYLPMENNYPAAFNFNVEGEPSKPYYYYMVKVFAAHNGSQIQMNEMYLCTEEEFDAARDPLVAYFDDFDKTRPIEASKNTQMADFNTLYAELQSTDDAVRMTLVYNQLVALRAELEESMDYLDFYADKTVDGVFQLGTADELKTFAAAVNNGRPALNAVLTADIDYRSNTGVDAMIGDNSDARYSGTFDGQGHTVTVNFNNTSETRIALFRQIEGGTIQNLKVAGTITTKQKFAGGIASRIYGSGTISNCESAVTISDTGTGDATHGGILGYIDNTSDGVLIQNCLFSGTISASNREGCGGIVGWGDTNNKNEVKNCLVIGEINVKTEEITAAHDIIVRGGTIISTNNYYVGTYSGIPVTTATSATATQKTSGELCYLLNGSVADGTTWTQTIGTDANPIPFSASQTVHQASPSGYTNLTVSEGKTQIANGATLKKFATEVNAGNTNVDAVLTADINLNEIAWTPIGTEENKYTGVFDGAGKAITNFSYTSTGHGGLFGWIYGATVKNFSIGGTLTVTGGSGSGVIGTAGVEGSGYTVGTISGIHSTLTVNVTQSGVHHVGGIVGWAYGSIDINRCSFAGSMTVANGNNDCFAGLVGYTFWNTIQNCANYGNITFQQADCKAGGILGYTNNTTTTIKNCLNTGTVAYDGDGDATYGGAIIGHLNGHDAAKLTNNYWLEGSGNGASAGNVLSTETNPSVSSAQLASGEVAYNLNGSTCYGVNWFQNLTGTADANPVLSNTHGIVNKISSVGYTTQYIPSTDVTIPTGVEVYAGEINGNWLRLVPIENGISKDDAVILRGDEGYYSFVPTTGVTKATGNVLLGSDGTITGDGESYYALSTLGGSAPIGFYPVGNGITIPAGKAYLYDGAGVKGFAFLFDDDPDAISSLLTSPEEEGQVYNLAGQRIQKMQKGINIVNGKKVLR